MKYTQNSTGFPVIRQWSAISAYGAGRAAFAAGVRSGVPAPAVPVPGEWDAAEDSARFIADFDVAQALGSTKTRALDRLTALAVSTVGGLLADDSPEHPRDRTAIVLGTNGSSEAMMRQTRTGLTSARPFFIDAAKIPSSVLNCAASRCAIWFGITGPNATLTTGRVAGLSAIEYAGRLLRTGRADRVLAGAADEYGHARSWIDHKARAGGADTGVLPGEGVVMFSLQAPTGGVAGAAFGPAAGSPVPDGAQVLGVRQRIASGEPTADDVRSCVERLLQACAVAPGEVWAAVPSDTSRAEAEALAGMFGAAAVDRVRPTRLFGDTGAATAAFQLASVLSQAAHDEKSAGRVAVITTVDSIGHVAAAALRLGAWAVV